MERVAVEAVDRELTCDPERIERHMEAVIEGERATFGSRGAMAGGAAETLEKRIAKLDQRWEGYEEMRADREMSRSGSTRGLRPWTTSTRPPVLS